MGIPVRLSDQLIELAKEAADGATRSLTSQVEHWAMIGHAVELALDHASLTKLKASGGHLAGAIPDAASRAAITAAIRQAVQQVDREALRARIASGKAPLHGVERSNPNAIRKYAAVHESAAKYAAGKRRKRG